MFISLNNTNLLLLKYIYYPSVAALELQDREEEKGREKRRKEKRKKGEGEGKRRFRGVIAFYNTMLLVRLFFLFGGEREGEYEEQEKEEGGKKGRKRRDKGIP